MNSDAKLQKLSLGPDWIDLSFGEPKVVMEALFRQLNRMGTPLPMPSLYDIPKWEYQPAAGKPDLVKILENKHGKRVVIGNGGKHALAAALYAFKKSDNKRCYFPKPFYPANPSLINSVGLIECHDVAGADCALLTSPNNPDGRWTEEQDILASQTNMPTIHDAAYYSEIYMPEGERPIALGHIQVFSTSKMYGLSGLRMGYAVAHDDKYYRDMVDYIEMTTAGVSTATQDIVRNIELWFREKPEYKAEFQREARAAIKAARAELNTLDPEVLILEPCTSNSMFAWCKIGPRLDFNKAKVYILDGTMFGKPGYMRMNIAHPPEVIREAVSRLNANKSDTN